MHDKRGRGADAVGRRSRASRELPQQELPGRAMQDADGGRIGLRVGGQCQRRESRGERPKASKNLYGRRTRACVQGGKTYSMYTSLLHAAHGSCIHDSSGILIGTLVLVIALPDDHGTIVA